MGGTRAPSKSGVLWAAAAIRTPRAEPRLWAVSEPVCSAHPEPGPRQPVAGVSERGTTWVVPALQVGAPAELVWQALDDFPPWRARTAGGDIRHGRGRPGTRGWYTSPLGLPHAAQPLERSVTHVGTSASPERVVRRTRAGRLTNHVQRSMVVWQGAGGLISCQSWAAAGGR